MPFCLSLDPASSCAGTASANRMILDFILDAPCYKCATWPGFLARPVSPPPFRQGCSAGDAPPRRAWVQRPFADGLTVEPSRTFGGIAGGRRRVRRNEVRPEAHGLPQPRRERAERRFPVVRPDPGAHAGRRGDAGSCVSPGSARPQYVFEAICRSEQPETRRTRQPQRSRVNPPARAAAALAAVFNADQ